MKNLIKLYGRPKLNEPNLLAAWPGIGNVSIIVAQYLLGKAEFKELGEINAPYFFDPIGVLAKDSLIEAPQFPQSRFYYYKTGEDQPAAKSYQLANAIIDFASRFHVKRIYTCAAALTRIHHTEQPRVWGVATRPEMAPDLAKYGMQQKGNLHISGLNGLLLGVAKERDVEGLCLLGEVPTYVTKMPNPMAALSIIRVLSAMLELDIDLGELSQQAAESMERMKQVAAEAMGEYIDYFTAPIWESGEDEIEDEE